MPILAKDVCIYPDRLFESSDSERHWWVAYTKSRQEKSLARQLLVQEIPFYLPLIPKKQLIRGRRFCSHLPLFSGYVFVFGSEQERVEVTAFKQISRILSVNDGEELRRDLLQISDLIDSNVPLTPESRLVKGQRVRITRGSLKDLEGTMIRRENGDRVLIAVNYLQQGLSVSIDDFMVEPL